MLKDADWYPLTIGLNQWKDQASTAGGQAIQNLVITGSLITIIPLVIAFLCLQKYWQSGLAAAPSRSDGVGSADAVSSPPRGGVSPSVPAPPRQPSSSEGGNSAKPLSDELSR